VQPTVAARARPTFRRAGVLDYIWHPDTIAVVLSVDAEGLVTCAVHQLLRLAPIKERWFRRRRAEQGQV
jgi:hypothetical protein